METWNQSLTRRRFVAGLGIAAAASIVPTPARSASRTPIKKRIPSTGELLPVVGLGTSRTFDAGPGPERDALAPVLKAFFDRGGTDRKSVV